MRADELSYDNDWGWWFTGLVDGEGCFSFRVTRGKVKHPFFQIKLRKDDAIALKRCRDVFGGRLYLDKASKQRRPATKDTAKWVVEDKSGLLRLYRHFEKYPLQCKKARDYMPWAIAVVEYQKPIENRDEELMKIMKDGCRLMKNYVEHLVPEEFLD